MFARLGPWCHDRRKLVLGLWVGRPRPRRRRVRRRRQRASATSSTCPTSSPSAGFDILDERLRRPGHRLSRHDRLPGRPGRRRPRGPGGDGGAVRRGRRRSTTSIRVESPYAEGGERQIASEGAEAGQDRLRQRRAARRHRLRPGRRDPRRDPRRARPTSTACDIELGGFIFAEFEEPSSEVLGLAFAIVILILAFGSVLAMGLPVGVALFGIGIGTAIITLLSNVLTDPRLRHVPRHHDRPRRRHRLRAADRHPLPRAAARRATPCASRSPSPSTPPAARCCSPAPPSSSRCSACCSWASASCRASPSAPPSVVAVTVRRLAHPAARAARLRRRARRAAPAGGASSPPASSPSPSSASASRSRRCTIGLPLAVDRAHRRLLRRPAQARGAPPAAQAPAARPPPTAGAGSSSTARGRPPSPAPSSCCVLAIPVLGLRLGFSDESNFAEDTTTKQAYDLLVDGLRPRLQRPAAPRRRAARGHRPSTASRPSPRPSPPTRAWRSCRRPSPTTPTTRPPCVWNLVPDHAARRTRRPPTWSTGCATTCCRRPRQAAGVDVAVTGTVAVNVDFSDYLTVAAAVLLRAPCWRCRSCC